MTQFHATLDEICTFVEEAMDRHQEIHLCAFAFPPSRQVPIARDTIRHVLAQPDTNSVVFTERRVISTVASAYGVAVDGYEPLFLEIGRLESRGLAESTLGTKTVTPLWKKLNLQLKKMTVAGADVISEKTGAKAHYRNHRFTAGAKALAASGIPLRQSHQSTHRYLPT